MARIQVLDLEQVQTEFAELSDSDLEKIIGGGWFKKLTGISTPKFLRNIDRAVRKRIPGGWWTVLEAIL
jgi:bacteriocin-like protein